MREVNNKQQMNLGLDDVQQYSLKNIFKQTFADTWHKFPMPIEGETKEEWIEFLYVETLLEVAERIKKIALDRQKRKINFYGKPIR